MDGNRPDPRHAGWKRSGRKTRREREGEFEAKMMAQDEKRLFIVISQMAIGNKIVKRRDERIVRSRRGHGDDERCCTGSACA